jgi:hypothetical protein
MCYYDRIRFFCGCQAWSEVRQRCDEAGPSLDNPDYALRRVRKHIFEPRGRKCRECDPLWDVGGPYIPVLRRKIVREQSPYPTPSYLLVEGHAPPHVSLMTPCSTATCILQSGHDTPHRSS